LPEDVPPSSSPELDPRFFWGCRFVLCGCGLVGLGPAGFVFARGIARLFVVVVVAGLRCVFGDCACCVAFCASAFSYMSRSCALLWGSFASTSRSPLISTPSLIVVVARAPFEMTSSRVELACLRPSLCVLFVCACSLFCGCEWKEGCDDSVWWTFFSQCDVSFFFAGIMT
jgi:hypothetical protein